MRVSCVEEDAGRASKKWSRPVGGNRGPRAAPPRLEKGREPIRLERRGSRTTARHREPACIPDSNPARLQRPAPSSDRCDSSECISSRIACSTRKHRSPQQRLEQSEQPAGRDTTPQSAGRLPACRGSAWIESVSSRLRCEGAIFSTWRLWPRARPSRCEGRSRRRRPSRLFGRRASACLQ
jgi:hypothetical protein